jgi:hypothetical protein
MKTNFIMPYTESGITLNFSDSNYFCFEDCGGYTKFSGDNFKEMDAGWFDEKENILYLIELKDFTKANLSENESRASRVWGLVKKSVDSCIMIRSALLGYDAGIEVSKCLPINITTNYKLKVFHILNVEEAQASYISFINDDFRNKFKAYQAFLNVQSCAVITLKSAKRFLTFIN